MRDVRRAAAGLGLAAALVLLSTTPSFAGVAALTSSVTHAVASGTWRLDARLNATDPLTGAPLAASGLSTKHVLYFSLVNFGTTTIVGTNLAVTVSKGNNTTVFATLRTCSGIWDEVADTCSGSVTTLGQIPYPSATLSPTVSIGAGSSLRVQVDSSLPGTQVTVSVDVSSGSPRQIRPSADSYL